MFCNVSHELSRVMLVELLSSEKDATRVWLRAEMDRLVDPMLDSIFDRLTTKLTNGLERTQSGSGDCGQVINTTAHNQLANVHLPQSPTSTSFNPTSFHFNHQHTFTNYQSQPPSNIYESIPINPNSIRQFSSSSSVPPPTGSNAQISLSNQLTNIETSTMPIKHEPNEQSNHNSNDQNWEDEDEDEEECDCDDCVNGGIDVKEEDEDVDAQLIDDDRDEQDIPRPLKRSRMDMNQSSNAQAEVSRQSTSQSTDEAQANKYERPDEEGDQMRSEQSQALQCSHCSRTFDYRCRLDQHVRMHTRPFECDLCDKRFTQKCNLDSHLRTHSRERPYKCRFCDKCFTLASHRNCHEQAKHLHVRPYRCKVCGLTATKPVNIIRHIRVVHFGLPRTVKEQRERNIIDERDPKELIEKIVLIV